MNLPILLDSISRLAWPTTTFSPRDLPNAPHDIAIVTAFFDTGRANWRTSHLQRTNEIYFEYFAHLAKLRNHIIVFTEPRFVARVLELRRASGLEQATTIFEIPELFACDLLAPVLAAIEQRMGDRFLQFLWQPELPEYWEPRYVLVNVLKSAFVCSAMHMGVIAAPQVAWIDFGYCRDDRRFDPDQPWRFDTGGKINLFHVNALDDTSVFQVVRSGTVYFHGASILGPAEAWLDFAHEIDVSLQALLECGLIDDDQTLLLMAWRRNPDKYRIHAVARGDWFVIFRRFDISRQTEPVILQPLRQRPLQPAWLEEMRVAVRRRGKRLTRTLKRWKRKAKSGRKARRA